MTGTLCCLVLLIIIGSVLYTAFTLMCIFFALYPHAAYKFTDALSTYEVKDDPWRYQLGYGITGAILAIIGIVALIILTVYLLRRCRTKISSKV